MITQQIHASRGQVVKAANASTKPFFWATRVKIVHVPFLAESINLPWINPPKNPSDSRWVRYFIRIADHDQIIFLGKIDQAIDNRISLKDFPLKIQTELGKWNTVAF